jgi:hypothetical protein
VPSVELVTQTFAPPTAIPVVSAPAGNVPDSEPSQHSAWYNWAGLSPCPFRQSFNILPSMVMTTGMLVPSDAVSDWKIARRCFPSLS